MIVGFRREFGACLGHLRRRSRLRPGGQIWETGA